MVEQKKCIRLTTCALENRHAHIRICIFFVHYVILSEAKNLFLTSEYLPAFGGDNEFPGDYTEEETPDPIPNSEAKLFRPMVVRKGESRSSPGIIKAGFERSRPFPFWHSNKTKHVIPSAAEESIEIAPQN